jgi:hypothetical protein
MHILPEAPVNTLKIHLTYQCTAQCAHCRFGCDPSPQPVIDPDLAMACVRALRARNGLNMVVLMGGEPGLYPELTYGLAAACTDLGLAVRVETNAFWASGEEEVRQFLAPLYALGASVMFSLDAFHEPHVPPERVERALRVSAELGGQHYLEMAYLDVKRRAHPFDRHSDALLTEVERGLGRSPSCRIYQGNVFYNGRAARSLASWVSEGRGVPTDTCERVPWWMDGELDTLDLLILDADGYLSKGCGIAIGRVGPRPVEAILDDFDARAHPIFRTLLETGPLGLAHEAEAMGYTLKADYADKCHLCQEARQVLRPAYPEFLTPARHYE